MRTKTASADGVARYLLKRPCDDMDRGGDLQFESPMMALTPETISTFPVEKVNSETLKFFYVPLARKLKLYTDLGSVPDSKSTKRTSSLSTELA